MLVVPDSFKRDGGQGVLAERIRVRRLAKGWSLRELANRAGVSSPSYILAIEKGEKVPSESVALSLAKALGDSRRDLYEAWVRAERRGGRKDWERLDKMLADPNVRKERGALGDAMLLSETKGSVQATGLVVPVLREFADPEGAGSADVVDRLVINPARLSQVPKLLEPFAYKLSPELCDRLDDYLRSGLVVINRAYSVPLDPKETYAVRVGKKVVLSRVWSNEALLLVLPATGKHDLVKFTARNEKELRRHIVGIVDVLIPEVG